MDARLFLNFSKPFIEALQNIYQVMASLETHPKTPEIKKDILSRGDVSAIIGINGLLKREGEEDHPFRGLLVIAWKYDAYLKLTEKMLGEKHTEYSEKIADIGGEMCNMVMGNAKRVLAEYGYFVEMAIPSIVEGKEHSIKYPPETTVMMIPVESEIGMTYLEVCLRID